MYNNSSSFRRLVGKELSGILLPSGNDQLLLFTAEKDKWLKDTTDRELILYQLYTQYHLQRTKLGYPVWFRATLAALLSSTRLEDNQALVGLINHGLRWRETPVISISSLLQTNSKLHTVAQNRNLWTFGHFLLLGRLSGATDYSAALVQYLSLLDDNQPGEAAFATAFGKTPEALEPELNTYIRRKDLKAAVIPLQSYSDIEVRQVPENEIRLLSGRIALSVNRPEIAAEQLNAIPEIHPVTTAAAAE